MYAPNLASTSIEDAVKYFNEQTSEPINPVNNLPHLIRRTPKFDGMKDSIIKFNIKVDNKADIVTSENLFNNLKFSHPPTNRAITILRSIFERPEIRITIYVRDEDKSPLLTTLPELFNRLHLERVNGNIFRHFYTQKLQTTNEPHNIDIGTALK